MATIAIQLTCAAGMALDFDKEINKRAQITNSVVATLGEKGKYPQTEDSMKVSQLDIKLIKKKQRTTR